MAIGHAPLGSVAYGCKCIAGIVGAVGLWVIILEAIDLTVSEVCMGAIFSLFKGLMSGAA